MYDHLIEEVRRVAGALRLHVAYVSLMNDRHEPVLLLPLALFPEPQPGADPGEPQPGADHGENGRPISQIPLDILATLRAVGKPMTTTRLLEEFAKQGLQWSDRAVKGHLAEMVKDGTLENAEDAKPRGYRLAGEGPAPAG
jgi:hypothetical protein